MTRNFIILLSFLGIVSCHSNQPAGQSKSPKDSSMTDHSAMTMSDTVMADHAATAKPDLKSLHFDYTKDPACGMPLTAGLEDTTHYKGKLYGFCSKECKEAFLKDPSSYTAKLK